MITTRICIFVLLCTGLLFAQGERGIVGEIICETMNATGKTYKFEIKPVSGKTTWCYYFDWYIVTDGSTVDLEITGNICWDNDYVFDVCFFGSHPVFMRTLNEFTIYKLVAGVPWVKKISFYIDYRDCRYGQQGQDIAIMVDGANDKVYYAPDGGPPDCDTTEYTEIADGVTLEIWEVNDYSGSRDVSCMCATPSLESITNQNNHPKVTWSHADDPNGSYSYEVWRLLTQLSHPRFGTWYLIDTVTDVEEYVDYEVDIGTGSWGRAYYKVRAKIDDLTSGYSGYGYINFQGLTKPLVQNPDAIEITEFKLYSNYPNPFNPSTKISFDIPEKTHVDLAVYDIQGKKVVTLVNEMLESGNYSVEFNAGQLPSGTYLYKIVAGEFMDSKKMMFVK